MKNIALIGYMASGKSTIAKILAHYLQREYVDLDQFIENEQHLSIAEIFETKGELFFRKQEHVVLAKLVTQTSNTVFALGGGTPCYAGNIDLLKKHQCEVIYLKASVETLAKRLEADKSRPLVAGKSTDLKEFVAMHIFERSYFYNQADIIINTEEKTVEDIAREIISKLT